MNKIQDISGPEWDNSTEYPGFQSQEIKDDILKAEQLLKPYWNPSRHSPKKSPKILARPFLLVISVLRKLCSGPKTKSSPVLY